MSEATNHPAGAPHDADSRAEAVGMRAFVVVLALCAAGLAVVLGSRTPGERELAIAVVAIIAPFTTVAAVRWYKPVHAWAWLLVAVAEVMWIIAIGVDPLARIKPPGSPLSVNEITSILGYVAAGWAVVGLGRRSDPGQRTLTGIDSAVIAMAVVAVVWVVFRISRIVAPGQPLVTAIGYPLADVFIAVAIIRFAARTSVMRPAYLLAFTGAALLLVTDLVALREPASTGRPVTETLQYLNFATLALAALHPSMASITSAQIGWLGDIGRVRVGILGASLLTPPVLVVLTGPRLDAVTALGLGVMCAVSLALVLVRLSGMVRVIDEQGSQLGSVARADHLTGLPNRRTVDAELDRTMTDAADRDEQLVVGLIDLDRFKAFNDERGHGAGDRLLARIGSLMRTGLPPDVFLGRYGGEEFALVVRGRSLEDASRLVDGLRASMPAGATFSAGLVAWDGLESAVVLVGRADRALYAAKAAGRDRVVAERYPGMVLAGARG